MNTRLLLRLAAVFAALTFTVHAATVPCWSVHEIALTATGKYANAYTDVEVTAAFTGPDGAVKTVRGFWDGGENFKVRLTPTVQGE